MPRTLNANELFRRLDTLQVFRIPTGTNGDTTLAASATAGATALNFTANTNFASGDPIAIVGTTFTELNAITNSTPATAVPLLYPLAAAQASGARIVELAATTLGHLEEAGIAFGGTIPLTAINSALQATPLAYIYGYGEMTASFGLLGLNGLNLQTIFGIPEAEIGTGSAAAPHTVALSGAAMGTQTLQCFRATGTMQDGRTIQLDLNNAFIAPSGQVNLNRTAPAVLPCEVRFTSASVRFWT